MKNIIKKWLGIDNLENVILKREEEKIIEEENKEWEKLKTELEKAEKLGLVHLMTVSCSYYAPRLARFCELSKKLEKWK